MFPRNKISPSPFRNPRRPCGTHWSLLQLEGLMDRTRRVRRVPPETNNCLPSPGPHKTCTWPVDTLSTSPPTPSLSTPTPPQPTWGYFKHRTSIWSRKIWNLKLPICVTDVYNNSTSKTKSSRPQLKLVDTKIVRGSPTVVSTRSPLRSTEVEVPRSSRDHCDYRGSSRSTHPRLREVVDIRLGMQEAKVSSLDTSTSVPEYPCSYWLGNNWWESVVPHTWETCLV